jgi:hypothetical protein
MTELIVILKDSDRTYRQTFAIYETFTTDDDDRICQACIAEARLNFIGEPDSIRIKTDKEYPMPLPTTENN